MTIASVLNKIQSVDDELYTKILNLQTIVYSIAKKMKCTPQQINLLYNTSALLYLDKHKEFKQENKLIALLNSNKNGQYVDFLSHKLVLILSASNYYNLLREEYNHDEALQIVLEYEFYPDALRKIIEKTFTNDLLLLLDYSFYDLNYEVEDN